MTETIDWQRPHVLSVLVLVGSFIANNMWTVVIVLVAGSGLGFDAIALAAGAATVFLGALGWYMTAYAVTSESVEHRSGILNRQTRSIPLDRIQQVSVAEPFLARVVGLAVVQVAEASSDGDVEIRYLRLDAANELTARLRTLADRREEAVDVAAQPPPSRRPPTRIHATRPSDLIRYRLAIGAPFLGAAAVALALTAIVAAVVWGPVAAGGVGVVAIIVLIGLPTLGVVGGVIGLGNFVLERDDRSLRIVTGMLSRREVEVRPDRIQTLTVLSGPVARAIGLYEVKFSAAIGARAGNAPLHLLGPAVRGDDVAMVVQGSVDVDAGFAVDMESVSPLTVRRMLARGLLLYVLVGVPASVAAAFVSPALVVVIAAGWGAVAWWFARTRFRILGLSIDGRRIVVRRGVLHHRLTQFPLVNVQSVSTTASWFQRRLDLADLEIVTAGVGARHHVVVPDLTTARATDLRSHLAATAAASSWELRG